MEQMLTYRYRIYPSPEQENVIQHTLEITRRYYNILIEEKSALFRETGIWKRKLPAIVSMEEYAKKHNVEKTTLEIVANTFDDAFRRFLWSYNHKEDQYKEQAKGRVYGAEKDGLSEPNLKGFPEKKPQHVAKKSYRVLSSQVWWQDNRVMLPQVGWLPIKLHRLPPKEAKIWGITVLWKSTGKYYLLVKFKVDVPETCYDMPSDGALGVVFVPGRVAVRSDLVPVEARYSDPDLEEKIERAYRVLSRRTPGGKRYEKQREKLARLIDKQTAQRWDARHKAARAIVDVGKPIGIQVPEVKKAAKYYKIQGMGHLIREDAWYQLYSMISYKARLEGLWLNTVYRRSCPINRMCSRCGTILDAEPENEVWKCPTCKSVWLKSHNAAKNLQHLTEEALQESKAMSEPSD